MNTPVTNYFEGRLPAGAHRFDPLSAARYVVMITGENGGPTSLLLKDKPSDTNGVADPDFTSGEPYAALIDIPLGTSIYLTLAGEEFVSIKISRRPDQ